MDFKDEKTVMSEMISQVGKLMLENEKDAFAFAKLLESKDFKNAYQMLSGSLKENFTEEDIERFVTEDPVDLNPAPSDFQDKQMPYKKIAIEFSNYLVQKEFTKAFNMLSQEQQQEYTVESLEKNMQDMTNYFENPNNIWVETQFVLDEGAIDDKCIYVPIEEDGNSEAVTVEMTEENGKILINSIEWGRP